MVHVILFRHQRVMVGFVIRVLADKSQKLLRYASLLHLAKIQLLTSTKVLIHLLLPLVYVAQMRLSLEEDVAILRAEVIIFEASLCILVTYGRAVHLLRLEMVLHVMMVQQERLLNRMLFVYLLLLLPLLPPPQPPLNSEPAALPDLPGIQKKTAVSQPPVEKDNSTVLHRRNVSPDEPPVRPLSVSMTESVLVTNLANVLTVSTAQIKLIQQRKQMTKTSVVSSVESKQCVVMISQMMANQEPVVSLQRSGVRLPTDEPVPV